MDKDKNLSTGYLFIPPPPAGYVKRLEEELNVSSQTINRALYHGLVSRRAEQVRKRYYELYLKPYLQQGTITFNI